MTEFMGIVTDIKSLKTPFISRHIKKFYDNDYQAFSQYVQTPYALSYYHFLDDQISAKTRSETEAIAELCLIRQHIAAKIAVRELLGLDDIQFSCKQLSNFAEACVQWTTDYYYDLLVEKHGQPISKIDQTPQHLIVLAMGKLGGEELNFSSDIDVIYVYPHGGETNTTRSSRVITNSEFFIRLSQSITQALSKLTEHGSAFRVDTRLRPFGSASAMASSFANLEYYYLGHARAWERFALSKARAITGQTSDKQTLKKLLQSFVYRKHIDFTFLEDLRETKTLIARGLNDRKKDGWHVKLGRGGIREFEFMLQTLQLIYGGRNPNLRTRGVFNSLPVLIEAKLLDVEINPQLEHDYCFLRQVEQRLQYWNDEQRHRMPSKGIELKWLIKSLGFKDFDAFDSTLIEVRKRVSVLFDEIVAFEHHDENVQYWSNADELKDVQQIFDCLDTPVPPNEDSVQRVHEFINSRPVQQASEQSRKRINHVLTVTVLQKKFYQPTIANTYLEILKVIVNRSVYLALLAENPRTIKLLLNLIEQSDYFSRQIKQHPFLLDLLLSAEALNIPPKKGMLRVRLDTFIEQTPMENTEQRIHRLIEFKSIQTFKVANAYLNNYIGVEQVTSILSWLATVCIRHAMRIALFQAGKGEMDLELAYSPVLVVAYGKLGSTELSLYSDLDLVILYDLKMLEPPINSNWLIRLTRKLLQILSSRTALGSLYEIDTRLRPEGQKGTVVVDIEQFEIYQKNRALVWEHQALVKARPIAGNLALAEKFSRIRKSILSKKRDSETLRKAIFDMRVQMINQLDKGSATQFDLKHGIGGLIDIEFMTQHLVLKHTNEYPTLAHLRYVNVQLKALENLMPKHAKMFQDLKVAYHELRSMMLDNELNNRPQLVDPKICAKQSAVVQYYWKKIFKDALYKS